MSADGLNATVTMDCGCTMRLNIHNESEMPKQGWYYPCPTNRHSEIRGYDPSTGDPIYERDRQVTTALTDGPVERENGS